MENILNSQTVNEECQIIKPTINNLLLILHSSAVAIAMVFIFGWFLGGFISSILEAIFKINIFSSFIAIALIVFIISFLIAFWLKRMTLKNTEYKFYKDRVEYLEGFLVKERKTISYDKITNIGQVKGIVEGWFGLGTIFLDTAGSSQKGHELAISYLDNPDKIYDWITKITAKK
jgi:membrane protein YdbS with pleckstrin-like domain